MNPTASPSASARSGRARPVFWIGWILVLSGLAYFIIKNVPHYFVFTRESYTDYYWPKRAFLLPHIIGGVVAAIIGPLQFVPKIRRDYIGFHRIAGRTYVVFVLLGATASLGISTRILGDDAAYGLGLAALAVAWLATTGMAFVAIRRKNIVQHKQWMIRSYVVTFAFVTFRLVEDLFAAIHILPQHEYESILAWGCWAVPLLFTELIMQSREVFRKRA